MYGVFESMKLISIKASETAHSFLVSKAAYMTIDKGVKVGITEALDRLVEEAKDYE